MEKERGGKLIAIIALVIAVIGLSVGFAAFSTTLNIAATSNVQVGDNEWNIGFAATSDDDIAPLTTTNAQTVNGQTSGSNNGVGKLMKYTFYQDTPATITTTQGSKVEYSFVIKNTGSINASLASITFGSLTCAYVSNATTRTESDAMNSGTTITANSDANATISSADCNTMFNVSLTLGTNPGEVYVPTPSSYNTTINAGSYIDVKLTIEATGTAPNTIPTGDFTVSLGNTTLNFQQAQS